MWGVDEGEWTKPFYKFLIRSHSSVNLFLSISPLVVVSERVVLDGVLWMCLNL